MLCRRKSGGVVAYASQMLTNSTPETSPSFANVDMGASATGYTVHKIFRRPGETIVDSEGAFRALYIGERSDELADLTLRVHATQAAQWMSCRWSVPVCLLS